MGWPAVVSLCCSTSIPCLCETSFGNWILITDWCNVTNKRCRSWDDHHRTLAKNPRIEFKKTRFVSFKPKEWTNRGAWMWKLVKWNQTGWQLRQEKPPTNQKAVFTDKLIKSWNPALWLVSHKQIAWVSFFQASVSLSFDVSIFWLSFYRESSYK